jgi:hypothetical protein
VAGGFRKLQYNPVDTIPRVQYPAYHTRRTIPGVPYRMIFDNPSLSRCLSPGIAVATILFDHSSLGRETGTHVVNTTRSLHLPHRILSFPPRARSDCGQPTWPTSICLMRDHRPSLPPKLLAPRPPSPAPHPMAVQTGRRGLKSKR